ncbi:unnamed protein product [Auanema sp. JU1783]|nr:unnamed protein product [Auanema sp. JU1783]
MSKAVSATERALRFVEKSSRIKLQDLRDNIGARTTGRQVRKGTNQAGHTQGALERAAKPPLGWIWGDFFRPWQRMFPGERHFNADINLRREYQPLSLIELSRLIDLGWVDPSQPIDVAALCRTKKFNIQPRLRQYGFDLTAEGADDFTHKIDIEVQYASQSAIAAVEKAGGRIRTAYYDVQSLEAAVDPQSWFKKGLPVPPRRAPPTSLLEYYLSPLNRGYLSKDEEINEMRKKLSLVMGYDHTAELVGETKSPNQIFHGIPAGSVVSLADKKIFGPTREELKKYYEGDLRSDTNYAC